MNKHYYVIWFILIISLLYVPLAYSQSTSIVATARIVRGVGGSQEDDGTLTGEDDQDNIVKDEGYGKDDAEYYSSETDNLVKEPEGALEDNEGLNATDEESLNSVRSEEHTSELQSQR